jgi:hypothetical protein
MLSDELSMSNKIRKLARTQKKTLFGRVITAINSNKKLFVFFLLHTLVTLLVWYHFFWEKFKLQPRGQGW